MWYLLSVFCALIVLVSQYIAQNIDCLLNRKINLKVKTCNIIALIFGFLYLMLPVIDKNISDKQLEVTSLKNDSLDNLNRNLNNKNRILLDSIKKSSEFILDNTSQLRTNTEKLSEISNIIYNKAKDISKVSDDVYKNTQQITGNGSYPVATWTGGGLNDNQLQILVHLEGEFALPNLEAKVVVIDDYSTVSGLDLRIVGLTGAEMINFETLKNSEFKYFLIPYKSKETAVIIYFKSDNHTWNETMLISDSKDGKKIMWFITDEKGITLKKYIDKNFPTKSNGKIVLWSNVMKKFSDI
ncbi:hypothetical protein E0I26_15075 [Flavobacterium rhamnosiphilum]|uniref:Uncharacterized protein n=1 Tax=Flavobacterium rhamnosiphilum TaxID=2541724 RepID=A0A4R5F3F5_9FLAO|nr:hypothetical protein [Flavobacterium rhamnosiphilum]TDE42037.1 hypothetical protein E0I26_15075 [Flavobacterium rhamnosiphilum]